MISKNTSLAVLLPAISFFSLILTWFSSYQDFSGYDLAFLVIACSAIVALQVAVVAFVERLSSNRLLANLLFSVFVLFNAYSLHLSFIKELTGLAWYWQIAVAAVGLYVVFMLKEISDRSRAALYWICAAIFALMVVNASMTWMSGQFGQVGQFAAFKGEQQVDLQDKLHPELRDDSHPDRKVDQAVRMEDAPAEVPQDEKITDNVRYVEFGERPNVYVVAFDSLMPEALLKSHLNLEHVPYSDLLNRNFHSFRNMFADDVATRGSLNSMLGFDMDYIKALGPARLFELFSGKVRSPLTELFRRNGYTINTLHLNNHLGFSKGPYLDNYFIDIPFAVCEFISGKNRSIAFFGFCSLQDTDLWKKHLYREEPLKHLLTSIEQQLEHGSPQFFLAYMFSPGHTRIDFRSHNQSDIDEYRQLHMKNGGETAEIIQQLMNIVDRSQGRDILVVMGDHGPYLSNTIKIKENAGFFIRDRYGIYGGIYPRNRCKDYFRETGMLDYNTPVIVLNKLLRCLSGGRDPFIVPQIIIGPLGAPLYITYEKLEYE